MRWAPLLFPLLWLSPNVQALGHPDGGVEDLGRPTDDNRLQSSTFACLMLSDEECGASSNATPILTAPGRVAAPTFAADEKTFAALARGYPHGTVEDIKIMIGRPSEDWIVNTCAIRVSHAMNEAGFPIDPGVQDVRAMTDPKSKINFLSDRSGVRTGRYYLYRVDELARYMLKSYGKPQLWVKNDQGPDALRKAVKGKKGVILFVVKSWKDATGHFDLWDGAKASHEDYFSKASDVFLWQ